MLNSSRTIDLYNLAGYVSLLVEVPLYVCDVTMVLNDFFDMNSDGKEFHPYRS